MKEKFQNNIFIFNTFSKRGLKFWIKYLISYVLNIAFHLILFCSPHPVQNRKTKYKVTLCAIFKNEAPFLKEWILFHKMIGIEHIYLYNNFSEDNYIEVLTDFINSGFITLTEWPIPQGQIAAYKHWYENYRKETQWNCFLDLDEYICPYYKNDIYSWLKPFYKYPSVGVYWKMFGTSGQIEHDYNKLTIEQYTVSWDKYYDIGKIFYNTFYDITNFNRGMMHRIDSPIKIFGKTFNIPSVNEFGYFFNKYSIHHAKKNFTIQINHYWSKAFKEYEKKHKRGDAVFSKSPRNLEYFLFHEMNNRSSDFHIFRFIISLKLLYNEKS